MIYIFATLLTSQRMKRSKPESIPCALGFSEGFEAQKYAMRSHFCLMAQVQELEPFPLLARLCAFGSQVCGTNLLGW